jgi:hypothetical protein
VILCLICLSLRHYPCSLKGVKYALLNSAQVTFQGKIGRPAHFRLVEFNLFAVAIAFDLAHQNGSTV